MVNTTTQETPKQTHLQKLTDQVIAEGIEFWARMEKMGVKRDPPYQELLNG